MNCNFLEKDFTEKHFTEKHFLEKDFSEKHINDTIEILENNWEEIQSTYAIQDCRNVNYYNMLYSDTELSCDQYNFALLLYLRYMISFNEL